MTPTPSTRNRTPAAADEIDVAIVGAGFAGIYQLVRLRELGFRCRILEAGSNLGGIWHWNCYPGARVDTWAYLYQYSREDLWRDWNWSEMFPDWRELRSYFRYVDDKLDLSKDVRFNTRVASAEFDESKNQWVVHAQDGSVTRAQHLILCTGFAAKPHIPKFKGLETFKGAVHHTGLWPQEGLGFTGKRVGVIGTGASAVQVIQEASRTAKHLTVFQRSPAMAIPMLQRKLSVEEQTEMKQGYAEKFRVRPTTHCGYDFTWRPGSAMSVSNEERQRVYEELWAQGGFPFWLANFEDTIVSKEANDEAYAFWRDKTRPRIKDPVMREKLAPMKAPYAFGCKRVSLEQWYYDLFDQDNVSLIDITASPIQEFTPRGIRTQNDGETALDMVVMGTGFDAVSGGILAIKVRGTDGHLLAEKWSTGVRSLMGISSAGYPNLYWLYGPQSPSGWSNGPTTAEVQGDMVVRIIDDLRRMGVKRIEPTVAAENQWVEHNREIANMTLIPETDSWYNGSNVPGKPIEVLNYGGGLPLYAQKFAESADNGYVGFNLS